MTEHNDRALNDRMEFDHIIQVHPDGTITDSPLSAGSVDAYFDLNVTPDGTDEFTMSPGWTLLSGFTGQYSYNGPVMHPSEFIGGGLERHILETPGLYVALEVSGRCEYNGTTRCDVESGCDCEPAGWAVAYLDTTDGDGRLVQVTYHYGNDRRVSVTPLAALKARLAREAEHATDENTRAGRRANIAAALEALENTGRGEFGWETFVWAGVTA